MRAEQLLRTTPRHSTRAVLAGAGFAAALTVAALDYVTGPGLSLAAFYVLVVVGITLVAGFAVGLVASTVTATVWAVADALIRELNLTAWGNVWNTGVHFMALAVVVVLVAALTRAVAAARESELRSRDFLAMAAHQLRTPVAAVRTSADALVHVAPGPAQERLLANLAGEAARLGRLIASLLRVARLDLGEPPVLQLADPRVLVDAELDRVRQLSAVEIELAVADDVPPRVALDVDATVEALANLLDNARRHAETRISVSITSDRSTVSIAVEDDGPGLPAGAEDDAFDRFVTFDRSGGSGLGLPIARGLARRQGGDVVYRDRRFVLSLALTPIGPATRSEAGVGSIAYSEG